jgi:hypothetical protein
MDFDIDVELGPSVEIAAVEVPLDFAADDYDPDRFAAALESAARSPNSQR